MRAAASADRCDVCRSPADPAQLAPVQTTGDGVAHVHVDIPLCLRILHDEVPEPAADDPPAGFAAARLRMDRLAGLAGRERPRVRVARHAESGIWHWADDEPTD